MYPFDARVEPQPSRQSINCGVERFKVSLQYHVGRLNQVERHDIVEASNPKIPVHNDKGMPECVVGVTLSVWEKALDLSDALILSPAKFGI